MSNLVQTIRLDTNPEENPELNPDENQQSRNETVEAEVIVEQPRSRPGSRIEDTIDIDNESIEEERSRIEDYKGNQIEREYHVSTMSAEDKHIRKLINELRMFGNKVDNDFVEKNPTFVVTTDMTSERDVARQLSLPSKSVSRLTERTKRSTRKVVTMMSSHYSKNNVNYNYENKTEKELKESKRDHDVKMITQHFQNIDQTLIVEWQADLEREVYERVESLTSKVATDIMTEWIKKEVINEAGRNNIAALFFQFETSSAEILQALSQKTLPTTVRGHLVDKIETKIRQFVKDSVRVMLDYQEAYNNSTFIDEGQILSNAGTQSSENESTESFRTKARKLQTPKKRSKPRKEFSHRQLDLEDSDEDESEVEERDVFVVTNEYNADDPTDKVDPKAIPIWKYGENDIEKHQYLEEYITDLVHFTTLKYNIPEARLIFLSLNASKRSAMVSEIPKEKLENLNDFIVHLKQFYGRDVMQLRNMLHSLQQKKTEQPQAFLQRVISTYYRSKGVEPKTMSQITATTGTGNAAKLVNPSEVADITYHFVNGLHDKRVIAHIKLDLEGFKLKDAAKKTMDIQRAFSVLPDDQTNGQSVSINSVDKVRETKIEEKTGMEEVIKQVMAIERKRRNRYDKQKGGPKNQTKKFCSICKKTNHNTQSCHFRNKVQRNGPSASPCFVCGGRDHWSNNCPEKRSQYRQGRKQGGNYQPKSNDRCQKCGQEGHETSSCKVALGKAYGRQPYNKR